jgi:O-antigen ligase
MTDLNDNSYWQQCRVQPFHMKWALLTSVVFCFAIFTYVALTNLSMFALLLAAPVAWWGFVKSQQGLEPEERVFLGLIILMCVWDVVVNLMAGHGLGDALKALMHDARTFAFVVALWALFTNVLLARTAFYAILVLVVVMVSINLVMTLTGVIPQGKYFSYEFLRMSHLSHIYGQALVGFFFVLAQMWLVRPNLSWRVLVPMALLVLSLFLASERRTGYVLLLAGFGVWGMLNAKRLFVGKYKWWLVLAVSAGAVVAVSSDVVQSRMVLAVAEFNQYLAMTPQERATSVLGAVSVRMQYVVTILEAIRQSNWWIGVGTIDLPSAYQAAAKQFGVSQQAWGTYNWSNPHNEYLHTLATRGVVGLALYLAIFAQACRVAWRKADEVQRVGLVMFVFLFMLSITTNSMMIDMEEGHFTLLILLVFLAPQSLELDGSKTENT